MNTLLDPNFLRNRGRKHFQINVQLSQFQTLLDVLAQGCTGYKGPTVVKYAVLVVNRRTVKGAKSGS